MENKSTAIYALIFLIILMICIVVAFWYNPTPVEIVKEHPQKSPAELLAERVKSRSSPSKFNLTPQNRASLSPASDSSFNNDPWNALDRVDNERLIKNKHPM